MSHFYLNEMKYVTFTRSLIDSRKGDSLNVKFLEMKVKQIDIASLKILGGFSKRNQKGIAQVIDLFKARKIERFDTARNLINDLGQIAILQRGVRVKEWAAREEAQTANE